jgi:hypothetical protein
VKISNLAFVLVAGFSALALALAPVAFAEDELPESVAVDEEGAGPEGDGSGKFDSRVRLERVVLFEDRQELAELKSSLAEAEALLQRAIDTGAEQEVIDRIQAEVDRRQAAVDASKDEIDRVKELIGELSPEQVFAYNRSLNNAISSKLVPYLDSDLLKRSLGADLDRHQINALTQALEQEARFMIKSDRFRALAADAGDDRYLAKADQMEARAESQKQKFIAKISDDPRPEQHLRDEARDEGQRQARAAARNAARNEARKLARESAREQAREASREELGDKHAAKQAQREAMQIARETAREEARNQARGKGKSKKD